ncbi:LacI family DNA-binding transcriptional regulator [Aeromonas sp. MR16]|uniref:LacI family DNA-binding transcriptional regulator n=1 Tax=Aeromonas sp. MR16 TaxID=2923420 RepID=UPI001F4AEE0F|nr:LacI family DNA-binding transcriptional regulator [Aeromonas sp. MR16]MCH7372148.1 LacI family transcriptional regulator [Aeromonas sp. MR16]
MSRAPSPINPVSMAAVAEQAGVSVATVSRVLNQQEGVTAKTRAKVDQAVHALGYRVNHLATSLRTAKSWLLLIMVPDLTNPFYIEVVRGIDRVARQHGYFVLLCDTGADPGRERSAFELLRTHRADGAICLDPDSIQQGLSQEINALPWVACCEFDPAMPVPYVGIDNQAAAAEAIRYLLSRGHRRIALIGADPAYLYARQREAGVRQALAEAGLLLAEEWNIRVTSFSFLAGAEAAKQLLRCPHRPTAIFAVADALAIGLMHSLQEAGLRIPDDIAIMGFDDIPMAAQLNPPLTTMAQPMDELGAEATRLLLQRLNAPDTPLIGRLLPHRLVSRGSV